MPGWRILLWAVLVLAALLFLYLVRGILLPFIVAFIIAALLEPTVRKLRLRGMSRRAAVTVVVGSFFVIVGAAGVLLAPTISRQIVGFSGQVRELTSSLARPEESFFKRWDPVYQARFATTSNPLDRVLRQYGPALERFGLPSSRRALMQNYVEPQRRQIAEAVKKGFYSFFGIFTNLFSQLLYIVLVPILVPMILSEMEDLRRRSPRWIPPSLRAGTLSLLGDMSQVFVSYLRGVATVVLLFTVAQTLLLFLFNAPYAFLLGVLFGALYLIPYIGNIISTIILFFVIALSNVSGNFAFSLSSPWAYALLVTLLFLLVGWIFDHLIYPQMVGQSVGLSPVVSMFVIFCGGALFGLPGMLIAFPLAGSVKVVLDKLLRVTSTSHEGLALPVVPVRHRASAPA